MNLMGRARSWSATLLVTLLLVAGCEKSAGEFRETSQSAEPSIDGLFEVANWAVKEIVRASPQPEKWGKLYLMEFESDYQLSGVPSFRYIDKDSIKVKQDGAISYADLRFGIEGGKIGDIESLFQVLLSSLATDDGFKQTITDLVEFNPTPSFYVERARQDILQNESERGIQQGAELLLRAISYAYFERPQSVEISFEWVSAIDGAGSTMVLNRKLDAGGNILSNDVPVSR